MARYHPPRCRICGITPKQAGEFAEVWGVPYAHAARISARGLCYGHGRLRLLDNNDQLIAAKGPYFEHWRERCRAAFGVLDDKASRA